MTARDCLPMAVAAPLHAIYRNSMGTCVHTESNNALYGEIYSMRCRCSKVTHNDARKVWTRKMIVSWSSA